MEGDMSGSRRVEGDLPSEPLPTPQPTRRPSSWKRLVYTTATGQRYHLVPHTASWTVTWTQRFAHDGLEYEPCQTCFHGTRPRHRGHLTELGDRLIWLGSQEPVPA